jgi:hypothetical protein
MNRKTFEGASNDWKQFHKHSIGGSRIMKKTLIALTIAGLAGFTMYGQDSAKDELKKSGHDVKEAGKATGHATKHAANGVAKGTKKGVHKAAKGTEKAADKVKEKTK